MTDEISTELDHLETLMSDHQKRLHVRERQAAQFGMSADPSIVNEIDDIESKLRDLNIKYTKRVMSLVRQTIHEVTWEIDDLQKVAHSPSVTTASG